MLMVWRMKPCKQGRQMSDAMKDIHSEIHRRQKQQHVSRRPQSAWMGQADCTSFPQQKSND